MSRFSPLERGIHGAALITVLIVISIFFIISVVLCTIVMTQYQANFESSISGLSDYLADAGLRYATARALYSHIIEQGTKTTAERYEEDVELGDPEYGGKWTYELYDIEPLSPTYSEDGVTYTHKEKICCLGQIFGPHDTLISQRTIYADLYLSSVPNAAGPGTVTASFRTYYEENR